MNLTNKYDYRSCQSLFGYALEIHKRYNCVCQLCGCGGNQSSDFDLWRQMTVEHIIGKSQGGYYSDIRNSIDDRFPNLSELTRKELALQIAEANTVSACSLCNATTSRDRHAKSMRDLIFEVEGDPDTVIDHVVRGLAKELSKNNIRI